MAEFDPEHVPLSAEEFAVTPVVGGFQVAIGQLPEDVNLGTCACGENHSKGKFLILTISSEIGISRFISFEGQPLYESLLNGQLTELGRACLARLEVSGLE